MDPLLSTEIYHPAKSNHFPEENGKWAQGVCAELMEILPMLWMNPYSQSQFT